jgi:hypothetical protein
MKKREPATWQAAGQPCEKYSGVSIKDPRVGGEIHSNSHGYVAIITHTDWAVSSRVQSTEYPVGRKCHSPEIGLPKW